MTSIRANAIEQHVVFGGPDDGPPVLLVHGLGWDHSLWKGQIETLSRQGWRVVAPDLRGMGATEKPDGAYTIDLYAADLLALMDAIGVQRFALVGFSLGGIITTAMIERAPGRIAAAVIACCGIHSTAEAEAATERMLARAAGLGARAFAEEQALAIWHPDWAAAHPAEVERFIGWRASMDQPALVRAFRAGYGIDYRPGLRGIGIPVRFVAADADPFASVESMAALRDLVRGAGLVVIERSGHMAPIEQRERFDGALTEFLDQAWPSCSRLADR